MGRSALAVGLLLLLVSCQSQQSRYVWGGFEDSVYALTAGFEGEGQETVPGMIAAAEASVERARSEGRLVPPGVHAQLGLLYGLEGRTDESVAAFESEKELYPEATVFIDGVLSRMGAGQPVQEER